MVKGIYKITNNRTGEEYIGQTNNLYFREKRHMEDLANGTHHNRGMQEDYNRGDTFSFEVLEYVDGSREELYEREKAQIRNHNSFYAGYNQTPGGEYDQYKGRYQYGGGRKPVYARKNDYHSYRPLSYNNIYTEFNDPNFKPDWSCAPNYDDNYYERNKHRGYRTNKPKNTISSATNTPSNNDGDWMLGFCCLGILIIFIIFALM